MSTTQAVPPLVSEQELKAFSRRIAELNAGPPPMTFNAALEILIEEQENPYLKEALTDIRYKDLDEDGLLSLAMARHPEIFPQFYIEMVDQGLHAPYDLYDRLREYGNS